MGGGFGRKKIMSVRNAKLIYTRPKQVEMRISDSQQMVSPESAESEININFPSRNINNVVAHSSFVDNLVIEQNTNITFSANIKIQGLPEVKTTKFYKIRFQNGSTITTINGREYGKDGPYGFYWGNDDFLLHTTGIYNVVTSSNIRLHDNSIAINIRCIKKE